MEWLAWRGDSGARGIGVVGIRRGGICLGRTCMDDQVSPQSATAREAADEVDTE